LAVSSADEPRQIAVGLLTAVTVGIGFTITDTVVVVVQPRADIPVTVYTVEATGLAVGLAQLVQLSAVAGSQV
jgi:hypothetical protein